MPSSPRHRHVVVLPLLGLLFLAITGLNQLVAATASVTEKSLGSAVIAAEGEEKQLSLQSGMTALLAPDTHVVISDDSTLRILDGSVLIGASGFGSVDPGFGVRATVLIGSMLAIRDAGSATLVALTAPVVVTVSDHEWILPPGTQLSIRADGKTERSEVPGEWLREQIGRSRALPAADSADRDGKAMLAHILAEPDTVFTASSVASIFAVTDTLHDSSLTDLVALRLALNADRLDRDASASVVERIRSASYDSAERFFVLPLLASSSLRSLPSVLIDLWTRDAMRAAAADPPSAVSVLRLTALALPSRFLDAGYPLQAELWQAALRRIGTVLLPLLPPSQREAFASDLASAEHDSLPEPPIVSKQASPVASPELVHTHPTQETIALSRDILTEKGVLLGTATTIDIDDDLADCAKVSGVFLQEGNRDIPYEFSLCPFEEKVRRIKRAGVLLPNTVSFEQFFR